MLQSDYLFNKYKTSKYENFYEIIQKNQYDYIVAYYYYLYNFLEKKFILSRYDDYIFSSILNVKCINNDCKNFEQLVFNKYKFLCLDNILFVNRLENLEKLFLLNRYKNKIEYNSEIENFIINTLKKIITYDLSENAAEFQLVNGVLKRNTSIDIKISFTYDYENYFLKNETISKLDNVKNYIKIAMNDNNFLGINTEVFLEESFE